MFEAYFADDVQTQFFHYGDVQEFVGLKDKKYMAVNLEFAGTSFQPNIAGHSYNVQFFELMDSNDEELEHECHSSCMDACINFLFWLNEIDMEVVIGGNAQPFTDSTGDRTAGIALSFVVQVPITGNVIC